MLNIYDEIAGPAKIIRTTVTPSSASWPGGGDGVHVADGQLFVNGKLLPEPYLELGTAETAVCVFR